MSPVPDTVNFVIFSAADSVLHNTQRPLLDSVQGSNPEVPTRLVINWAFVQLLDPFASQAFRGGWGKGGLQDDRADIWRADLAATIAALCSHPLAPLTSAQMTQYNIMDGEAICPSS